jgi:hypothetical protein
VYADIRGQDYQHYIKELLKTLRKSYMFDMTLFKLLSYYYMRSHTKGSDQYYEDAIAEIFIRSRGESRSKKDGIMRDVRKKKLKSKKPEKDKGNPQ